MTTPLARKLYLRIWLTVAGSVAVLGLLVGWAWHVADEQRDRERERQLPQPREVLVRDAAGALIGTAEAQPRRVPGQGVARDVLQADAVQAAGRAREIFLHQVLAEAQGLIDTGVATGGMIPKLETAIAAVEAGVEAVVILDGRRPHAMLVELFTEFGAGTLVKAK